MSITKKITWLIKDYMSRHTNNVDRILHIIGIPQVIFGIYQMIVGEWKFGLLNFFLGYLWQWIGHKYFEKNEVGEVILIKDVLQKLKK